MYWWNIDRLAEELKTGTLPEEEKMKYFLADSIITAAISLVPRAASLIDPFVNCRSGNCHRRHSPLFHCQRRGPRETLH